MHDHESAVALIEARFPELSSALRDPDVDGLLHAQIAEFSHFAQEVIDRRDESGWDLVTRTFLEVWDDCSRAVTNALNVSFLEHLRFRDGRGSRAWAYYQMPEVMRTAWDAMDADLEKIHGNSAKPADPGEDDTTGRQGG